MELSQRINWYNQRLHELETKAENNGGKLKRHELWRCEYYKNPYLASATQQSIDQRFEEIFANTVDLNMQGQLVPSLNVSPEYTIKFTHLLEEHNVRGGLTVDTVERARMPFVKYFDKGDPIGVELHRGYNPPHKTILVKYSKKEHIEKMLRTGTVRISQASFYSGMQLGRAMRDDEVTRTYEIPTHAARLAGHSEIQFEGKTIRFLGEGDIQWKVTVPDYYLFSTCMKLSCRMPDDFDADAALVISDKRKFLRKLTAAFNKQFQGWKRLHSPVKYFDPYTDHGTIRVPQLSKNFGYSYQNEHRIVFIPPKGYSSPLEPIFVTIGDMSSYAELLPIN